MLDNIDHIVFAVHDLQKAISTFAQKTGLEVAKGGRHVQHGTHNALVRIGNQTYLEFIAKDKNSTNTEQDTWMGLDLLTEDKLTRWALSTQQFIEDADAIRQYDDSLGQLKEGSREKNDGSFLRWNMTNVLPHPEVDPIPFLLDWKDSTHPTSGLPLNCSIIDFRVFSPEPKRLTALFDQLGFRNSVLYHDRSRLELTLGTPKGHITL